MNSCPQRLCGFSLIEVLVALALMSLIATILMESLRVGGRTWQQVTRKVADVNDVMRTQNFLRERLATLRPASTDPAQSQADSLIGESEAVEFSSVSTARPAPGRVRYWLGLSQSDPAELEIRYRRERDAAGVVLSDWTRESLLPRVKRLSIQYWFEDAVLGGRWLDHWEDNRKLPRLIRVEVTFADKDSRRWPPLYVETKLDTGPGCVFDVVSRRCREAL